MRSSPATGKAKRYGWWGTALLLAGCRDDGAVTGLARPSCLRDAGNLGADQIGLPAVAHVHLEGHEHTEFGRPFGLDAGGIASIRAARPAGLLVALLDLDGRRHAVDVHGGGAFAHGVADGPVEGHRAARARHRFGLVGLGQAVTVGRHLRTEPLVDQPDRVGQGVGLGIEQEDATVDLDDEVAMPIGVDAGTAVVGDRIGLQVDHGDGGGRLRDGQASHADDGEGSEQEGLQVHGVPLSIGKLQVALFSHKFVKLSN